MNHLLETAQAISAAGFFAYGLGCLVSPVMRIEFARYGMPQWRVVTGGLQIAASMGLIAGFRFPVCALLAAAGLSLMMCVAVGVRVKIKDPLAGFLQALGCLMLNMFITWNNLVKIDF
jgi:DoxX-like family